MANFVNFSKPSQPYLTTKFILYNLAAKAQAYYLVDRIKVKSKGLPIIEPLSRDYDYQIFVSSSARKIQGTNQTLKILGLQPADEGIIYKYKQVTPEVYQRHKSVPVVQNEQSVYAFAKANLVEGNLNTAKYAIASTYNATLTQRHAKALINQDIASFAQDLDTVLFCPETFTGHQIRNQVKVNQGVSLLELIQILDANRGHIILNLKYLQHNYQRTRIRRVEGVRDVHGNVVKPTLGTVYADQAEYVHIGGFRINHNTATINMLISRQVQLVQREDRTPITEVAGFLVNDIARFNNYTIVSDGKIHIKSLPVKISSKKLFDVLKAKGVLDGGEFDFRAEYIIRLDNLPLVHFGGQYGSLDRVFSELAEIKVLSSILAAYLREESDVLIKEQSDELKKHYLSKNLYLNFPTTKEYGEIDSHISYKIDIGSKDILNLGKLYPANKFLTRRYEVYNPETGEIWPKPKFSMLFDGNIVVKSKPLSARMKITKVDELMKPIFDDFLGLERNGKVAAILSRVGGGLLVDKSASKEEMIAAMTSANTKLEAYAQQIYCEQISPLVFYIGATGLLPEEMAAKPMTAEEVVLNYPSLQLSKHERGGTFFVVGDSIISVYSVLEYYPKQQECSN